MKIYLDDDVNYRITPDGWHRTFTAPETIELLKTEQVTHLSLDHDLGPPEAGTGYDVVCWIEQMVIEKAFNPPIMTIHSANPVGRQKMQAAIHVINITHNIKLTQPTLWEEFISNFKKPLGFFGQLKNWLKNDFIS
jgi:hypothetical protein